MLLLIAVYEGQHQGSESPMTALARGLRFECNADLEAALWEPGCATLNERYGPAVERLLARGGLTIETATGEALGRFVETMVAGIAPSSRWLLRRMGFADYE